MCNSLTTVSNCRFETRIGLPSWNSVKSAPPNDLSARSAPFRSQSVLIPTHFDLPLNSSLAPDRRSTKRAAGRAQNRGFLNMSFPISGSSPSCCVPWPKRATPFPPPFSAQAIPAVLAGRDVLAGAQTGTGKTAAFVLPILQNLAAPARHCRRVRWCSHRRANSPRRWPRAPQTTAATSTCARSSSSAVSARSRRSRRCAAAAICWWPRPGGCSISPSSVLLDLSPGALPGAR